MYLWKTSSLKEKKKYTTVKSRRLDQGLLSETHETLFSCSILKRFKLEVKQMKSKTYSLELALLNKRLKMII